MRPTSLFTPQPQLTHHHGADQPITSLPPSEGRSQVGEVPPTPHTGVDHIEPPLSSGKGLKNSGRGKKVK
jgi:hypothetical protein